MFRVLKCPSTYMQAPHNDFVFSGFACFKSFFENVNIYEHKLKKPGMVYFVKYLYNFVHIDN